MSDFSADRLLGFLTSSHIIWGAMWFGLAVLTGALLVLMRTQWGQSHPLRKCAVLSIWAHLLMAAYAMTVPIVISNSRIDEEPLVRISIVDHLTPDDPNDEATLDKPRPWERFLPESMSKPDRVAHARAESVIDQKMKRVRQFAEASFPGEVAPTEPVLTEPAQPSAQLESPTDAQLRTHGTLAAQPIPTPPAQRREAPPDLAPRHAGLDRQNTAIGQPDSTRPATGIVTSELPEVPSPAPRLADGLPTVEPTASLTDLVDIQSQPAGRSLVESTGMGLPLVPVKPAAVARIDSETEYSGEAVRPEMPDIDAVADDRLNAAREETRSGGGSAPHAPHVAGSPAIKPPPAYRLRTAPNRQRVAKLHGGSPESEIAVEAALRWLASSQSADGRWRSNQLEGGRELTVGGRNRRGTGAKADTGITGLALLAFLGAGHTHSQGQYQDNVRRGLQFLVASQTADGNLSGQADTFAAMYCHGMAALALGEAFGMTGDGRLRPVIRRAIAFTVQSQHKATGGWRYRPGDLGDTSQLGWQVMALRSAELAGIAIPEETWDGAIRFLKSVSAGTHGGLASYRPDEKVSRSMTAEALFCRQLLGMRRENPASREAADFLVEELPGRDQANLYYWYYATLGLFQLQGDHWHRWNAAMQETLIDSQTTAGPSAGSWNPDSVWAGYGGQAYSTAMAALCLEVYYRFLPLQIDAAARLEKP